jgi:rod shape-determining protein MreB
VKCGIGAAVPLEEELTMDVRGRDQITGLPRTTTLSSNEITQAIQDCLASMVQTVRVVLERTPPELAADVIDRGIVLTGGGALLRHLDLLLTQEIGIPVHVADNPLECTAVGAAVALEHLEVIKRSLPTEEESLVASA